MRLHTADLWSSRTYVYLKILYMKKGGFDMASAWGIIIDQQTDGGITFTPDVPGAPLYELPAPAIADFYRAPVDKASPRQEHSGEAMPGPFGNIPG
jgi:hypothetical protein